MWDAKTCGGSEGLVDLAQALNFVCRIVAPKSSSANISQVPRFSFHVGPLEPVVSVLGHFFEAFYG